MASLNRVFLMGNLTRDPELRYIPSGSAVATFTVALNRVYKLQSGEKKEETSFVRVVAWGKQAELCSEYLAKGSPVFVEGRIQSRSWDAPDGQKRSATEVVANNIQFLRSSAGAPKGRPAQEASQAPRGGESSEGRTRPASAGELDEIQLEEAAPEAEPKSGDEVPF